MKLEETLNIEIDKAVHNWYNGSEYIYLTFVVVNIIVNNKTVLLRHSGDG
jgi:hypothetical protein